MDTSQPPGAEAELDSRAALDLWFDRQQRQWWRSWRWAVLALTLCSVAYLLCALGRLTEAKLMELNANALSQPWTDSYMIRRQIEFWSNWLIWILACILGTGLVQVYEFPPELSSTISGGTAYSALRRRVRFASYVFLACSYLIPVLIFRTVEYVLFSGTWLGLLSIALNSGMALAGVAIVSEFIQLLKLRSVWLRSLYAMVIPMIFALVLFLLLRGYYFGVNSTWNAGALQPAATILLSAFPFVLAALAAIVMAISTRNPAPPGK